MIFYHKIITTKSIGKLLCGSSYTPRYKLTIGNIRFDIFTSICFDVFAMKTIILSSRERITNIIIHVIHMNTCICIYARKHHILNKSVLYKRKKEQKIQKYFHKMKLINTSSSQDNNFSEKQKIISLHFTCLEKRIRNSSLYSILSLFGI